MKDKPESIKENKVVESTVVRAYAEFEDTSGAVYIDVAAGCCYPGEMAAGPGM